MLVLALVVASIYLSRPIFDQDFYWHLKTGQWIWQHKSLPTTDPFTIPPLPPSSPRTDFILSSYWLSQLILYACYTLGGMSGIIVLRWILAGISFAICTRWVSLRNSSVVAVMMLGSTQVLYHYSLDRPQFYSFICFGALLVILFSFFDQPDNWPLWRLLVSLSLLMAIWANLHGGFFVGLAILTFCAVTEGCKFSHPSLSPLSRREYRILLIATITALAASFLNPNPINTIKLLPTILDESKNQTFSIAEYYNVIKFFKLSQNHFHLVYFISLFFTGVVIICSRHRKNLTWIGILAVTGYIGFLHVRYMAFFFVSATIFSMKALETEITTRRARLSLYILLLALLIYCVDNERERPRSALQHGWVPPSHFPTAAADFITTKGLHGNVLTSYDWGGYMIWRLAPENKIFCDGRVLDFERMREFLYSYAANPTRTPYWKQLFDKYDIQIVVLPYLDHLGEPDLLNKFVRMDKDWMIVFDQNNSAVFVRAQ